MVLKRVLMVLVIPLGCALFTRKYLPGVVEWVKRRSNLSIYLWSINLSIIMGFTMRSLIHAPVSGWVLWALCIIPLVLSLFQFRSEEHTSELQSRQYLVCRLLL